MSLFPIAGGRLYSRGIRGEGGAGVDPRARLTHAGHEPRSRPRVWRWYREPVVFGAIFAIGDGLGAVITLPGVVKDGGQQRASLRCAGRQAPRLYGVGRWTWRCARVGRSQDGVMRSMSDLATRRLPGTGACPAWRNHGLNGWGRAAGVIGCVFRERLERRTDAQGTRGSIPAKAG
jgi:hypothetical protein